MDIKLLSVLTISLLFGVTWANDCRTGGKTIRDTTSGFLSSPPSWSTETSCLWVLRVPVDKFLRVKFTKFDLKRSQGCSTSYFEFSFNITETTRFCGQQFPPEMTFAGPSPLLVMYGIGKEDPAPGFKMEFELLDTYDACSSKMIKCRNNRCVNSTSLCNRIDDCGDGTDEEKCEFAKASNFECGKPTVTPILGNGDRIVGGQEAIPNSWPWQVSIQLKNIFPSGHFCGGSLIANQWVITAGHCFEKRKGSAARIRFGDHDNYIDESGEIIRYIDQVFLHPKYTPEPEYDIALLKLSSPLTFTDHISPVCLPKEGATLQAGVLTHITGWGDTMSTETSEKLKQVMVPVLNISVCNETYIQTVPLKTLCTHNFEGGSSPCMGDSGGPLVIKENGLWTIHGLVSWGHMVCGNPRGPAVYTNVGDYKTWIMEIINNN